MSKAKLINDLFEEMNAMRRVMHRRVDDVVRTFHLTRPQLGLMLLLLHERDLSVSQIAEQTGVTNGAATQTIAVMVRRALVERRVDEQDRRVSRVRLSSEGLELAERMHRHQMERMTKLLTNLEESELAVMAQAFAKLNAVIKENHHASNRT